MNKKLIVLMLLLPLLLMLSIFTSTQSVSLNVSVAVNKIEISGENIVYLDLEKNEKYLVSYAVYPVAASNKKVLFTTEKLPGEQLAELEFVDGYIIPKSVGLAKVYLTTVDGGYKDSFIVKVESNSLISINSEVESSSLSVGETVRINTTFNPNNYKNQMLNYSSSDSSIVSVNSKGLIRGEGRGTATITVTSDANNLIKDEIEITVYNEDVIDLNDDEFYLSTNSGFVNLSISASEYTLSYKVYDTNYNLIDDVVDVENTRFVDMGEGRKKFEYSLRDTFVGSLVIRFELVVDGVTLEKECVINKVTKVEASFDSSEVISKNVGMPLNLLNEITLIPADADVEYDVILSNNNLIKNNTTLITKAPGVTKVTLNIKNKLTEEVVSLEKDIVIIPSDIFINEKEFNSFGIENIWTIGRTEVNGGDNISKLTATVGPVSAGDNFYSNYSYYSNNDKVSVASDGTIKILDENFEGMVEITGKFAYNGVVYKQTASPITVRCLGNGVNVRNFADLYNATENSKVVVLQDDIVEDFGKINGNDIYTESTVKKITSTYDITHYENLGKLDDAKIKILISFKNNVYGNGYIINSGNVAYGLDSSGAPKQNALFKGPRNFVSMSDSESSMVSVKGQDNVSFAVYENVTLNNVVLKSCELKPGDDGYNLTDLTYVGTTVEVFGDNVNIEYCRLSNGRTVLRCFGDISIKNKVINVSIKNTEISNAREFLIRMGTNAFVDGTKSNPSPFIDESDERIFPVQKDYEKMSSAEKNNYDNKYIKTFVKIKNSLLKDSGLFCIGIDTHFSGVALADGSGFADGAVASWQNLAKTSYGAKLTLEGDVRMYNWKELSTIDSSSLIEIYPKPDEGSNSIINKYQSLNFDVKELIDGIAKDYYSSIISEYNGKRYVHGGIAFFGGGKNYSVVSQENNNFHDLTGYSIKLSQVNKSELQVAAGGEPFYFLIHDDNTQLFKPANQESVLGSESPIYKKD